MPRVTITVPERNPQPYRFQLDRTSVSLGRGSDNDIPIDCGSVSVKHAEMRRVEGGYELRDLGSTNGLKVDGERESVVELHSGMTVKLGDVAFDFQLSDEELEALASENLAADEDGPQDEPDSPARPSARPAAGPALEGGGGGFGMIVLFLILAAAAFFAGMAVRYQKDTGGSLIDAIKAKNEKSPVVKPADPAPAPEQAPPAEP
jgi:pSer/pThr/pTyr-binding forkhead associated (FHA) protein